MDKLYSIIFCCDREYGRYLIVAIEGLLKHCAPTKKYEIIIIDCGLDEETIAMIKKNVNRFANVKIQFKKFIEIYKNSNDIFYSNSYITNATYARFFIKNLTSSDVILYLDVDICIECDVADIIDTQNPDDKLLSAAPDIGMEIYRRLERGWINYFKNIIKLDFGLDNHYFNAGVLVINRQQWIEQDIEKKLLTYLSANKNLKFLDQDVLNIICFGQVKYLDFRYNVMASEYRLDKNFDDPLLGDMFNDFKKAAHSNERLIHYTTGNKPWSSPKTNLAGSWWQICRQTAVYEQCLMNLISHSDVGIRYIKILGIPLFKIKQDSQKYKFYIGKIHISGWIKKSNKKTYYLCGLPLITISS